MQALRLVLPLALLTVATAQSVTVPSSALTTKPYGNTWWSSNVFYSTATTANAQSHSQLIYSVTDITTPVAVWNSISIRRPGLNQAGSYLGNTNYAGTTNATVNLSVSSNVLTAVTNTFAANVGPSPATVISGPINLPAGPASGTWPHPWIAFPFTSPYTFVKPPSGTLVVDILQTGNTSTASWYLEAQLPDNGGRNANGAAPSTCKNSSNTYASGLSYNTNTLPGSNWFVNYNGLPPNAPGFAWLGGQGVGGTYAGFTLPIDIGPYGAPGCFIYASVDLIQPLTANASGSATWPTIMVPNNPALGGLSFFDHSLWLDALANPFGAVVGWSSRWAIGTGLGAPAATVSAISTSALNATGTVAQQTGVSLQFN